MQAIIERDFFPELSKLESKVAWLQAVRSGDPEQIRHAQLLIAQRRAAMAGGRPAIGATPANAPLFTPGGTAARAMAGDTPYIPHLPPGTAPRGGGGGAAAGPAAAAVGSIAVAPPGVSLDAFLAAHTSEDNASFQEILEDVNKRRRCVAWDLELGFWVQRAGPAAAACCLALLPLPLLPAVRLRGARRRAPACRRSAAGSRPRARWCRSPTQRRWR